MTEPIVQAALIAADDPEARKLATRAANRRKLFDIWLRPAPGTYAFKLRASYAVIDEHITDTRERERLTLLLRKIRGLLRSCAPDLEGDHDGK